MKSLRATDGSDDGDLPGVGRNAERLYRKCDGQSSRLCFVGHLVMKNRNGLIVDSALPPSARRRW